MANEIVGMGTLPNVYISKIDLDDNNTSSFKVTLTLELMDAVSDNKFLWSDDNLFFNFVRIGVITTSNKDLNDALTRGSISPLPSEIKKSPFYTPESQPNVYSIREFSVYKSSQSKKFYMKREFIVDNTIKDYFVYAYAFIDTAEAARILNLDMTGKLKNYCGPVKSEVVLRNATPANLTSLLLKPDNSPWPGPVHLNNGNYMAGASHTTEAHATLKKVNVQNLKLRDHRTSLFKNRTQVQSQKTPFVSDLHYSVDSQVKLTGIYMINMAQFMLLKVKNARKILGVSPKMFQELMDSTIINSMSVIRQEVKTTRGANKSGTIQFGTSKVNSYKYVSTTKETAPNVLKNTDNLKQFYVNNDPGIRYYQFIDKEMSYQTKGEFKYKVMFTVKDRSEDFVDRKIRELNSGLNTLKEVVTMLGRKTKFNYDENKLRPGVPIPPGVAETIKIYYNSLTYLRQIDEAQKTKMIKDQISTFMVGTYEPLLGERFVTQYEALISEFRQKFQIPNRQNSGKRPRNLKNAFMPGILTAEKEWKDVISFNEYRRSYDYLGVQDNEGLASMPLTQFSARGNRETNRFFEPEFSMDTPNLGELPIGIQADLKDLSSSKLTYFAPLYFYLDDETIDISDMSKVDNDNLTTKFMEAQEVGQIIMRPSRAILKKKNKKIRRPNRKLSRKNNRMRRRSGRSRFKVSMRKAPTKLANLLDAEKKVKSSDYLGSGSAFINPPERDAFAIPEQDFQKINADFQSSLNVQTDRNKLNYDLKASNNFLSEAMTSKSFKSSKIKNAPNHFKALIASRATGVRNNVLSDEGDVLQNPNTKVITEMTFQTLQRVEMMAGFEKDKIDMDIVTSPNWIPFDSSLFEEGTTVICRMVYAEQPEIGMKPSKSFKLPVRNAVFVIAEGDILKLPPTTTTPDEINLNFQTKSTLSRSIIYARTNIVTQNMRGLNNQLSLKSSPRAGAPTVTKNPIISAGFRATRPRTGGPY